MAGFLAHAGHPTDPGHPGRPRRCGRGIGRRALGRGASAWWVAGHRSTEPAHTIALADSGSSPLWTYGMRLGEGTGALIALPTLRAAVAALAEMTTFDAAGVSEQTAEGGVALSKD